MKLVIQIPCLNEEQTLPRTLADLPTKLPGVDEIEVLLIDDGCTDGTVAVARAAGVRHFVHFASTRGLARAFSAGLDAALKLGADLIVNTDADNQYSANDIERLIAPILSGQAEMVVGARDIENHPEFGWLKKQLQWLGTRVVCAAAGLSLPDATSGFRAFSRQAAMRLFVHSDFSYTLETLIQAGRNRLAVAWVPVRTNRKTRDSRLFRSIPSYLRRSASTILRIVAMYEPLRVFFYAGSLLLAAGVALGLRFLWYWALHDYSGHVQSLILATVLLIMGFQIIVAGLLADLIAANRRLLEDLLHRVKARELDR
jgi:glycosyltransferase involved in cell wall biosynthesis